VAVTASDDEPPSAQELKRPNLPLKCPNLPLKEMRLPQGRLFDQEIIVYCVRWYLTFKLSSRDLVQMMAERGITLTHRYVRCGACAATLGTSVRSVKSNVKISVASTPNLAAR
jgi:hypothetical protein